VNISVSFKCVTLQNSWATFIYVRCQNVNRKETKEKDAPKPKRVKVDREKHAYAALDECEDEVSSIRNLEYLRKEISKPKPKPDVVKELLKRTLSARRNEVVDGKRPCEIIEEFPHLRKANYVSYNNVAIHYRANYNRKGLARHFPQILHTLKTTWRVFSVHFPTHSDSFICQTGCKSYWSSCSNWQDKCPSTDPYIWP
jgi:hypothetical protein